MTTGGSSQMSLSEYRRLLDWTIASLAVDGGTITAPCVVGTNTLQDISKEWAAYIHTNRIVKVTSASTGRTQQAFILANSQNMLRTRTTWVFAAEVGSKYTIVNADFAQILRDVLGGGTDIGLANPLPVAGVIAAGNFIVTPFTNTGNILPAVVRATLASSFSATKVHIHWSLATSNPVTIALVSIRGAAYNTPLRVQTMGANQDISWYFQPNAKFEANDVITVAWTDDTGGAAVWGVLIGLAE